MKFGEFFGFGGEGEKEEIVDSYEEVSSEKRKIEFERRLKEKEAITNPDNDTIEEMRVIRETLDNLNETLNKGL